MNGPIKKPNGAKGQEGYESLEGVEDHFLQQCVSAPTRGQALLDLVLGKELAQVDQISAGEH